MAKEGRQFTWATQRIAELEQELERARRRYKARLPRIRAGHVSCLSSQPDRSSSARARARALQGALPGSQDKLRPSASLAGRQMCVCLR